MRIGERVCTGKAIRGWLKIKNREYWRYEMEREGAIAAAKRRSRAFV